MWENRCVPGGTPTSVRHPDFHWFDKNGGNVIPDGRLTTNSGVFNPGSTKHRPLQNRLSAGPLRFHDEAAEAAARVAAQAHEDPQAPRDSGEARPPRPRQGQGGWWTGRLHVGLFSKACG